MTGNSEKKPSVLEKLEARKAEREKKKLDKSDHVSLNVLVDRYSVDFNKLCKDIKEMLAQIEERDTNKRDDLFIEIKQKLNDAQRFVADNSGMLPAYDVASSQDRIKKLNEEFEDMQDQFIVKKKFKLKKGTKNEAKIKPKKELSIKEDIDEDVKSLLTESGVQITNKTKETINLNSEDVKLKDINISNIAHCKIIIKGSPSTVHLTNVEDSQIFMGPVATSIFLDKCVRSNFHIACQQLRAHNSTQCDIFIHVTSRSIIEDCTAMTFSPYDFSYPDIEKDYQTSKLSRDINNWDKVDDFNWLSSNEPSPNWNIKKK